jgi:hypothetical protein
VIVMSLDGVLDPAVVMAAPPVWTADATTVAAASAVGQSSPSPSAACTASFRPPCPADNWPPRVIAAPVWAGSARRSTKWLSVLCAVVGPEPGRVARGRCRVRAAGCPLRLSARGWPSVLDLARLTVEWLSVLGLAQLALRPFHEHPRPSANKRT